VKMIFQIHKVDHYVMRIIYNMHPGVLCVTVQITKFKIPLHVKHTSQNGINTKKYRTHNIQSGIRRMLQRPGETQVWNPQKKGPNQQRHDEDNEEPLPSPNFFGPARYYCVETICAPCGVVIAWTKFARSESPTNILQFLEDIYQNEASRPDYICIDKGCKVL